MTRPLRIDLDPEAVGRGFTELVVVVMEVLRELLERQAIRRLEAGDLTPAQIERVGSALRDAREQLDALRAAVADTAQRPGKDTP